MPAMLSRVGARSTKLTMRSDLPPAAYSVRREVLPLLRKIDDHRNVQAGVARPAFAARHAAAVVAVVEDDGVAGEARLFDFLQAPARVGIGLADLVVILRPVLAHLRRVRMIGGDANVPGLGDLPVRTRADLALVALGGIEDGEERLAGRALVPMGLVGGLIPDFARLAQVVILLAVVRAVVAGLAQELRIHPGAGGHGNHGAHVQSAGARGIHAGDDRRAGRSADRGDGPGAIEDHAFRGQAIDVRRAGQLVAIAAHFRAMVLAGDPENIRMRLGRERRLTNAD